MFNIISLFFLTSNKKEEECDDNTEPVLDEEEPLFQDDPTDLNYQPLTQR